MKYCPTCETRYDEEILRFCTKDGTPLLEEEEPHFIHMPSESIDRPAEDEDDDEGDVTVVRRNIPVPPLPPSVDDDFSDVRPHDSGQRIVVPTVEERQEVRARVIPPYQPPPQRSNTALTVLLTVVGTLAVVAIGLLGFYLLQSEPAANTNANFNINANLANANINVNTNVGLDTNFNFNLNTNFNTNTNVNTNANANLRTPTPTPRPSPTVTPSPTPDDEDETPTPTPARTPVPTPTPIIIRPGTSPSPRVTPANRP